MFSLRRQEAPSVTADTDVLMLWFGAPPPSPIEGTAPMSDRLSERSAGKGAEDLGGQDTFLLLCTNEEFIRSMPSSRIILSTMSLASFPKEFFYQCSLNTQPTRSLPVTPGFQRNRTPLEEH